MELVLMQSLFHAYINHDIDIRDKFVTQGFVVFIENWISNDSKKIVWKANKRQ